MTHEEALACLTAHRRRLLGTRWVLWLTVAAVVALGAWLALPTSWGVGMGPWPFGIAMCALGVLLAAVGLQRRTVLGGSLCGGLESLEPMIVAASGAGRIAVRPEASLEDRDSAQPRLAWQAVCDRELPEPGRRVWIDAARPRGGRSPVVVPGAIPGGRADGKRQEAGYVAWPTTAIEREGPTRFVVSGVLDASAGLGDEADAEVLAAARRQGRWAFLRISVFGGLPVAAWFLFVAWGLLAGEEMPFSTLTTSALLVMLLLQWGIPRFGPSWRLWQARGLRRAVPADPATRALYSPAPTVVVLVDPGSDGTAAAQVWRWTALNEKPSRGEPRELWLPRDARPGRLVAAYVVANRVNPDRVIVPATRVGVVRDSELEIVTDDGSRPRG